MKGLLIKDYRLLLWQKNQLIIFLPIGLLFLFTADSPAMGISYTLYVMTFLSISLLSYDDFENGMVFLMTLPCGRKTYVTEKYVFNLINSAVTGIVFTIIASALLLYRGADISVIRELILTAIIIFGIAVAFFSLMLPIQLKFGAEKSRVVMMIFFGIILLATMAIGFVAGYFGINIDNIIYKLNELSLAGTTIGVLLLTVMAVGISWAISQKAMEKRDF